VIAERPRLLGRGGAAAAVEPTSAPVASKIRHTSRLSSPSAVSRRDQPANSSRRMLLEQVGASRPKPQQFETVHTTGRRRATCLEKHAATELAGILAAILLRDDSRDVCRIFRCEPGADVGCRRGSERRHDEQPRSLSGSPDRSPFRRSIGAKRKSAGSFRRCRIIRPSHEGRPPR